MPKCTKEDNLTKPELEYQMQYGGIPSTQEEILAYIEENFRINPAKLQETIDHIKEIQWETIDFSMKIVPKPSPRPRLSKQGYHFYVKGAADNKKAIAKYVKRHIICTRTEIDIRAYLPTPVSSMSNVEIYLAEAGMISPVGGSDVDNLMKTYLDMIQGHLLLNDNIVTKGTLEKFYSLKPRLEITIRYQTDFDSKFNRRKVTSSKSYKDEFAKETQVQD